MRDGETAVDPVSERKEAQALFDTLPFRSVSVFAARLRSQVREQQLDFAWFLGAGCSVTSGILPASWLARQWIDELYQDYRRDPAGGEPRDAWANLEFGPLAVAEPAALYSNVIKRRFHTEVERQTAIEQLCSDKRPGHGYLVMAKLITHPEYGARWNTVLTTNFDELLADAIYAIGTSKARPQVISHQSLAPHIRLRASRPTIVKVHGDHMLGARNTADEIAGMGKPMESRLTRILDQRGLIILGYGGFDPSIEAFLVQSRINHPIYWVGTSAPSLRIAKWLDDNNAQRVAWPDGHVRGTDSYVDFDQTLLELSLSFELEELTEESLGKAFDARKAELIEHVRTLSETRHSRASSPAEADKPDKEVERVFGSLLGPDVRAAIEAQKQERSDPANADILYQKAIKAYPHSAKLLGTYANFLRTVRGNYDAAEEAYKRAIEADPKDAAVLGNYGSFLATVRGKHDYAEDLYRRAIAADPERTQRASILGNYANFLRSVRGNSDAAENLYKRAIEDDPKRANNLSNYANFLTNVRGNHDAAEDLYKRAIDADPNNVSALGNYANFLKSVRHSYAAAEGLFKRAIDAAPQDANILSNYAQLLLGRGRIDVGPDVLRRAFEALPQANPPKALLVELRVYVYAHQPQAEHALARLKAVIVDGARSPGWSFKLTVERAIADGHPDPELLKQIVAVVSNGSDPATLDAFPAWRAA